MVFHHLLDGGAAAMGECFRVLKRGGRIVLSEGVPPDKSLRDWYTSMFALKEARLTFFEDDLVSLLQSGGFTVERVIEHVTPQVSIRNWLENSGLPQKRQDLIMQMHRDLDERGKQHYNMKITENDILCDFRFLILVGCKLPAYVPKEGSAE
jgi:ubiquinone/menaquinone biosynthesis C-methylase UbiE